MAETRILAVEIDSELFDKLDDLVAEEKISKKKFVSSLLEEAVEQKLQQKQAEEIRVKSMDAQKTWDKTEVMSALDKFMLDNGRIPSQKEFKNENGLPSYGAAGRALEISPAEYMRERFDVLMEEQQSERMSMGI